jgi:hypothetical protein
MTYHPAAAPGQERDKSRTTVKKVTAGGVLGPLQPSRAPDIWIS